MPHHFQISKFAPFFHLKSRSSALTQPLTMGKARVQCPKCGKGLKSKQIIHVHLAHCSKMSLLEFSFSSCSLVAAEEYPAVVVAEEYPADVVAEEYPAVVAAEEYPAVVAAEEYPVAVAEEYPVAAAEVMPPDDALKCPICGEMVGSHQELIVHVGRHEIF